VRVNPKQNKASYFVHDYEEKNVVSSLNARTWKLFSLNARFAQTASALAPRKSRGNVVSC